LELLRSEDGKAESMFQRVCRQMAGSAGIEWDSVTVIAGELQRDQILTQLDKDINILIEPDRRDTFPAISYAAAWLRSEKNIDKNEVVAFMPVDPFVELAFFDKISTIEDEISTTDADIMNIGCKPDKPTEKFGYILVDVNEAGGDSLSSKPVKGFKEKPATDEAADLISKGALWNCGVFGLRLGYILDYLTRAYDVAGFDIEYMRDVFNSLPKKSFDYEVMETAKNIRAIEYAGQWKDLGTWSSLTEEMNENIIGNVIAETSEGSYIINELDIPVVSVGMKDTIIVASHEGVLVAAKEDTERLKSIVSPIENRPMYEKRRWGEYMVLHRSSGENDGTLTKRIVINPGEQISYQIHTHRKEIWTIIKGRGILYFEGEKREIEAGVTIDIDIEKKHGIYAITELELIETQFGFPLIEEDIIRLEYDWAPFTE